MRNRRSDFNSDFKSDSTDDVAFNAKEAYNVIEVLPQVLICWGGREVNFNKDANPNQLMKLPFTSSLFPSPDSVPRNTLRKRLAVTFNYGRRHTRCFHHR